MSAVDWTSVVSRRWRSTGRPEKSIRTPNWVRVWCQNTVHLTVTTVDGTGTCTVWSPGRRRRRRRARPKGDRRSCGGKGGRELPRRDGRALLNLGRVSRAPFSPEESSEPSPRKPWRLGGSPHHHPCQPGCRGLLGPHPPFHVESRVVRPPRHPAHAPQDRLAAVSEETRSGNCALLSPPLFPCARPAAACHRCIIDSRGSESLHNGPRAPQLDPQICPDGTSTAACCGGSVEGDGSGGRRSWDGAPPHNDANPPGGSAAGLLCNHNFGPADVLHPPPATFAVSAGAGRPPQRRQGEETNELQPQPLPSLPSASSSLFP